MPLLPAEGVRGRGPILSEGKVGMDGASEGAARTGGAGKGLRLIVLLGVVSLFADMTYESARSLTGPYLAILGASAAAVGFVAGLGELVGYGLRLASGWIADRTRSYWTVTIVGYGINLLAVPALALANRWEWAAALIVLERLGKAVRAPARDALLAHASSQVGRGIGFALHEAMDQVGAMAGPVLVTLVLAWKGSYPVAFAVLAVPAALALAALAAARVSYPRPRELEAGAGGEVGLSGPRAFPAEFWMYLAAIGLVAAAYADFPLIAFHLKSRAVVEDKWIPLFYAGAMGVDALAALAFGWWYDRKGIVAVAGAVVFSAVFPALVFSSQAALVAAGMALWGIGMGAQESIARAAVAGLVSADRRATGYGVFNTGFGIAWFAGSALMGVLYARSLPALVGFSVLAQAASLPLLYAVHRRVAVRR